MTDETQRPVQRRFSFRSLIGGAAPKPRSGQRRRSAPCPITKSELQKLFARELGDARGISAKIRRHGLRQLTR